MTLAKVTLLGRAARVAHIDGATFFSIVNKAWGGLVGMVSVVLIAKTLSPVEQGFYYTFSSLLALQVVLELGFSYVIAQVTAHEFALSEQHESTSVRKRAFSRLISVFWLSLKWYGILAIFFAVFCSMSGEIFFHATSSDSPRVWNIPWLLAVMTFALSIPLIPVYSFLEGCNRVSAVAKARTIQDVVAYCALWGMFLLGAGLYAVPALYLAKVLAGISGLILTGQGPFLLSILRADVNTSEAISWRKEIFPFQWKIGLSWLSGYLIFQLISPALFSAQGPKAAGQAGMTIAIFTGFNALMSSWVITKSPYFCQLVALGRSQELRAAFRRAALTSTLISVLGLCTLVGGLMILRGVSLEISERILSNKSLIVLAGASLANHIITSVAVFLRAFKEEPFVAQAITVGLLMALTVLMTSYISTFAVAAGYSAVIVFVSLPWAAIIFMKRYREVS